MVIIIPKSNENRSLVSRYGTLMRMLIKEYDSFQVALEPIEGKTIMKHGKIFIEQ